MKNLVLFAKKKFRNYSVNNSMRKCSLVQLSVAAITWSLTVLMKDLLMMIRHG